MSEKIKKQNHRKLGNVLHIVGKEAICKPLTGFKGKGLKVWVGDEEIGTLQDPFGNVNQPYQAILLHPKFRDNPEIFVGKEAIVRVKKKKKRNKRYRGKN